MLIERVIGPLPDLPPFTSIDWIDLQWQQSLRRSFRGESRDGRTLRILLPLGYGPLRHEDVLWLTEDGRSCIAVNLLPADMLVATPLDTASLARLVYEIGNLHVPMEIDGRFIVAPADGPIEEAFERAGVSFEIQQRRFQPTCRSMIEVAVADQIKIIRKNSEKA